VAARAWQDRRVPTRVLFVCLGNICRSPTAEAVTRRLLEDRGLDGAVEVDSAAIGPWHVGKAPDPRAASAAAARGTTLAGTARQITAADFHRFDLVLGMDAANVEELRAMAPPGTADKVRLLADEDVPDPYYGDERDFDKALDIVEKACERLVDDLRQA
jgi:protein-tyrosine phosphatase